MYQTCEHATVGSIHLFFSSMCDPIQENICEKVCAISIFMSGE